MTCYPGYTDLAPLYALGSLTDSDRTAFQTHLRRNCRRCASLLEAYENVAALLYGLVRTSPTELTRRRMLRRVAVQS